MLETFLCVGDGLLAAALLVGWRFHVKHMVKAYEVGYEDGMCHGPLVASQCGKCGWQSTASSLEETISQVVNHDCGHPSN
jgi:hypothetical protein